jgi:hypothetical protein
MQVPVKTENQLSEPTSDGLPDENARANCVDASLSGAILGLNPAAKMPSGVPVDGDALKDAVYGQGYTGATDPARFMPYINAHADVFGVTMRELLSGAEGPAIVDACLAAMQAGAVPTLAIPSLWGNQWPGGAEMRDFSATHPGQGTHEVDFKGWDGTNFTAMNPWGGFDQVHDRPWWEARIVYGRAFALDKASAGSTQPVSITIEKDATGTITGAKDDQNGNVVGAGMAALIEKSGWQSATIAVPEVHDLPGKETIAVLRGGARVALTYSDAGGVRTYGDDVVLAFQDLYTQREDARKALAAAQATEATTVAADAKEEASEVAVPALDTKGALDAIGQAESQLQAAKAALGG